ncbi:hypothetical protein MKW92_050196 [Papaver armeniacum]|nr:hypothetical protein MKW92_050196 [Papaver armeniacum]
MGTYGSTTRPSAMTTTKSCVEIYHAPVKSIAQLFGCLVLSTFASKDVLALFLFPDSYASPKFVLSMYASKDVLALASLKVDLSSIEPGSTVTVKWHEKAVFIRSRTEDDMNLPVDGAVRVNNPELLIVVGVCTHLGCIPLPNGWGFWWLFGPCHGSHYVISGRIPKGPTPKNLQYLFTTFRRIRSFLCF